MSAALLREAAEEMRRRAEAATPGPWTAHIGSPLHDDAAGWVGSPGPSTADGMFVASVSNATEGLNDVGHIASWHPAVALAVADLLKATADLDDFDAATARPGSLVDCALTVARAFLGRSESPAPVEEARR